VTTTAARLGGGTPVIRRMPGVRLVVFSLIGIALYFLLLSQFMSQATAAQQVANALTLGAIYALIALGYTMVYGIIELINFAHGDVFMVGAFMSMVALSGGLDWTTQFGPLGFVLLALLAIGIGLALSRGLGTKRPVYILLGVLLGAATVIALEFGLGGTSAVLEPTRLIGMLGIAFVVSMVTMGTLNVTIERFAYRPLRHAPRLAPLITAIGVSFILQNVVQIWQGTGDRGSPQVYQTRGSSFELMGAQIGYVNLLIIVVSLVLMIGLQLFVSRTRLGRAMRSTAQDQQAAQLMGVDLNQTIAITFLLGGALAGAAGVFQGLYFGFVRFDLGFNAGLKAFTAAVLGGIGNLTGALLGGFLIGFVENFAAAMGQQRWSHAIVFVVLIVVLVFRPAGILGQQIGERA
jgi:branched-chain amino acid transport system permease protein